MRDMLRNRLLKRVILRVISNLKSVHKIASSYSQFCETQKLFWMKKALVSGQKVEETISSDPAEPAFFTVVSFVLIGILRPHFFNANLNLGSSNYSFNRQGYMKNST